VNGLVHPHPSPAIYLHWNGGAGSVYAFLDALRRYGALGDIGHTPARFTQLAANYFGGTLSVALIAFRGPLPSSIDPGDNGVYLVTLNHGNYTVRRWIDRIEQDAEFVQRERAEAYAHRYHTGRPTLGEQIDEINAPIFRRNELTRRSAANDRIGG
jgi:hypothetical protein